MKILKLILISIICSGYISCEKEYPLRIQPELDRLDITTYLRNERFLKLQVNCILKDGPCDAIGRWSKPRVKGALLGECLMCTEIQKGWLATWFNILIDKYPDLYRAAISKYLYGNGIQISDEEIKKLSTTLDDKFIDSILSKSNSSNSIPNSNQSMNSTMDENVQEIDSNL